MGTFAAVVELGELVEVVWISLLAGIGVTTIFSVALLGGTRSAEARRAGEGGAAAGYGVLSVLAALVFAAGVVLAVKLLVGR